eukprot:m.516879 g.516879  ORF g.516879 m.516879 type:complete len:65 (+) comp21933_c0_seq10:223-417(+)
MALGRITVSIRGLVDAGKLSAIEGSDIIRMAGRWQHTMALDVDGPVLAPSASTSPLSGSLGAAC